VAALGRVDVGTTADVDPFAAESLARPYRLYRRLRDEAPVARLPGTDYYTVSRYEDVVAVALDTDDYSSKLVAILTRRTDGGTTIVNAAGAGMVDVLAIADPPDHGRQRKVMQAAFSPSFFRSLEDHIRELAGELLTPLLGRGSADWMGEFAFRLPMSVALELVGFPRGDWARVKAWCDHGVALLSGINTEQDLVEHGHESGRLVRYVAGKLEAAQATAPPPNVTATLVQAIRDGTLSDAEAASIIVQILIAGNDSSASTMGNALRILSEDIGLQTRLRNDPSRIPDFVEEVLRLESPFQGHFRITKSDCRLRGVDLPKGTRLMLLWGAANRDERVFENPDVLDIDRPNRREHVGFGHGIHHCLGAPLARLEVRIALEEVLARTHVVERADTTRLAYLPSVFVRTLTALPVRFVPRPGPRAAATPPGSAPAHERP
jgi:cytochrome P450